MIRKPYERQHKTTPSPAGSKMAPTYEIIIDQQGHKELKQTGFTNIYAKIQEALESTLIQNIIDRATLGDPAALNAVQSHYIDATDLPENLMDAQNLAIRLQNEFDALPASVKAKFENKTSQYVEEYGTNEWLQKIGINLATTPDTAAAPAPAPQEGGNNK